MSYSPDGRRIVSGSYDNTVRVWDAETGECRKVIECCGDVKAIADPTAASETAYRALRRGPETVVECADTAQLVAWFAEAQWKIATPPSARRWAGSVSNHLYLLQLEGDA